MKLLGISDLAKRWNYTKQGVHGKIKNTSTFPKPIGIINQGVKVFLEEEALLANLLNQKFKNNAHSILDSFCDHVHMSLSDVESRKKH